MTKKGIIETCNFVNNSCVIEFNDDTTYTGYLVRNNEGKAPYMLLPQRIVFYPSHIKTIKHWRCLETWLKELQQYKQIEQELGIDLTTLKVWKNDRTDFQTIYTFEVFDKEHKQQFIFKARSVSKNDK